MTELVAITPADGRDLRPWIVALAEGGCPGLLIREPDVSNESLIEVLEFAEAHIPWVVLHARHPAARELGRPLHLPSFGAAPLQGIWGRSCHSWWEVERSLDAGAAWVTWSPVWQPTSKPGDPRSPIGIDRFLERAVGHPVLALGGVTAERFGELRSGGAAGAAVLGALFHVPLAEVTTRCRAYLSAGPPQDSGVIGNRLSKSS